MHEPSVPLPDAPSGPAPTPMALILWRIVFSLIWTGACLSYGVSLVYFGNRFFDVYKDVGVALPAVTVLFLTLAKSPYLLVLAASLVWAVVLVPVVLGKADRWAPVFSVAVLGLLMCVGFIGFLAFTLPLVSLLQGIKK